MILDNPFFCNIGFNDCCPYPEGGFLKFPCEILQQFGVYSRTITALWAMEQTRFPTRIPAALARNGCMPVKTIKKHIAKLLVDDDDNNLGLCSKRTDKGLEYFASRRLRAVMQETYNDLDQSFVQIPRIWFHFWPDATFTELLLLAFYRFKLTRDCGEPYPHPCRFTMKQIQERLGFSVRTWERSAQDLERRGFIVREKQHKGHTVYAVRLPSEGTRQNGSPTRQNGSLNN